MSSLILYRNPASYIQRRRLAFLRVKLIYTLIACFKEGGHPEDPSLNIYKRILAYLYPFRLILQLAYF
jgi:hypothetical protein